MSYLHHGSSGGIIGLAVHSSDRGAARQARRCQINGCLGAEDAIALPAPHPFHFRVGHTVVFQWHGCPPLGRLNSSVRMTASGFGTV
jgi:hypothetical protein